MPAIECYVEREERLSLREGQLGSILVPAIECYVEREERLSLREE